MPEALHKECVRSDHHQIPGQPDSAKNTAWLAGTFIAVLLCWRGGGISAAPFKHNPFTDANANRWRCGKRYQYGRRVSHFSAIPNTADGNNRITANANTIGTGTNALRLIRPDAAGAVHSGDFRYSHIYWSDAAVR